MGEQLVFPACPLADTIMMEPLDARDKATAVHDTVPLLKFCKKRIYEGGYTTMLRDVKIYASCK